MKIRKKNENKKPLLLPEAEWQALKRMAALPTMDKTVKMMVQKHRNQLTAEQKQLIDNLIKTAKDG